MQEREWSRATSARKTEAELAHQLKEIRWRRAAAATGAADRRARQTGFPATCVFGIRFCAIRKEVPSSTIT